MADEVEPTQLEALPLFTCSVCLYVRPRPGLSEDERAELSLLTVIDGQMVCLRHAGCARANHHSVILAGVHMESNGQFTSLSNYQDWRYRAGD